MMPADMQSQAAKQYRDLIDGSLADLPLPQPPKPSYVDSPAEELPHSGADTSFSRISIFMYCFLSWVLPS